MDVGAGGVGVHVGTGIRRGEDTGAKADSLSDPGWWIGPRVR
jgi:hypothetical protein